MQKLALDGQIVSKHKGDELRPAKHASTLKPRPLKFGREFSSSGLRACGNFLPELIAAAGFGHKIEP